MRDKPDTESDTHGITCMNYPQQVNSIQKQRVES